jgi:hypothetical protein
MSTVPDNKQRRFMRASSFEIVKSSLNMGVRILRRYLGVIDARDLENVLESSSNSQSLPGRIEIVVNPRE